MCLEQRHQVSVRVLEGAERSGGVKRQGRRDGNERGPGQRAATAADHPGYQKKGAPLVPLQSSSVLLSPERLWVLEHYR